MPEEDAIEGKVIRIPDKYSAIIDVGRKAGVKPGMYFIIYETGESIYTPKGKNLGKIEHVKAIITVTHVQENFSVAESAEFEEKSTFSTIMTSLKWKKPFTVSEKDLKPFASLEKAVKVGDLVKQSKLG